MLSFCYLQAKGINDPAGCIIFVEQANRTTTILSGWLMIVLMVTNNQVSFIFILIGINFFLTSFIIYSVICKQKIQKIGQDEQLFMLTSKCCNGNIKLGEFKFLACPPFLTLLSSLFFTNHKNPMPGQIFVHCAIQ